ncbi:trifunctional serine/threonine-protein kinase/ATP-binding protein/sensor histidine kinase [Calothrix sp. 336/3]|uniref:trifunctional serine/threonine-protein kinase/ATP-binding protein/sensor histidine kinase n=1 Tax=Calothrix sp. 336/3 TaxID=1337936 RepID=UPI0004E34ABD|nr:ATP-binding sensor histidine kinase [Calothrix sp. 336/3]AKG20274.1 serine/threonine protein kinase [Calothrix sp. 336/3]
MALTANNSPDCFPAISGYRVVEQLYLGSRTVVYRAVQVDTQHPVVIKVLRRDYPNFGELVQFRNQYTIAKNLPIPGIIQPLSLEVLGSGYALVMEDCGGVSLGKYIQQQSLNLTEVLAIALQIADIIHDLIQHRVVHKDIKPANILIQPESKQVKLIDFSIASLLPKETQEIQNPNILEGTLAYLAPEQTGRMNRGIDYRADFYALGVTLYELLSGQLPFDSEDPMELVHCHIAKIAKPVDQVNPTVPSMVGAIVAKLMAKNAEDRYQSALGLQYDLQQCLTQWKEAGVIAEFQLGQRDLSDRFLIPEKLYGRENEVQTLLNAFERISQGASELMLVAGFSGIGKTAVVNEVHKPITRQKGYFIKGKFDQFNRNIPLSTFVQALRDLMGQLLSESDAQLAQWKAQILEAVGENGQVLLEVIPELEQLIGKQPAVAELSGSAAQNRFNLLFQKFIQVFTTVEHPLVIFLDDLQWADSASLELIKLLMNDNSYLLILGAYRDNEVSSAHPFILTVEELKKAQAIVNTITLAPLNLADTNHLVADTLSCSRELAQPLTELIDRKTQGNPFFTTQFLKALYEDGYITFERNQGYWQCDIAQVNALALTDDVVEFMALQLQKLSEKTQQVLKLAACVGNQFDLATLAIVSEQSATEVATALWKALQEGLILPTSQVYKFFQGTENSDTQNTVNPKYRFLHDRVQQAAYSLIPEDQKTVTHLKIGQSLQANASEIELDEKLFNITNHLNIGESLITEPSKRTELAQLNLNAAYKAKLATAYSAAIAYCSTGMNLLAQDCWESQYELTLILHNLTAEVAYLNGDFAQMDRIASISLKSAKTLLDRIPIYETQIQAYMAQNRLPESIQTAMNVLKQLGISLPQNPSDLQTLLGLAQNRLILVGKKPASLLHLPTMSKLEKLAAMRILSSAASTAFISAPKLFPLLAFQQVNLSVQYGNSPLSAYAYAYYGIIICGVLVNIEEGYEFGRLALEILEKFNAKELRSKVVFVANCFIFHWKQHLQSTLPGLQEAYEIGLETGDLEYASWAAAIRASHLYWSAHQLSDLAPTLYYYGEVIKQSKQHNPLVLLNIYRQAVMNLLGESVNPSILDGAVYSVAQNTTQESAGDRTGVFFYYVNQIYLSYLFGEFSNAVEQATIAKGFEEGGISVNISLLFCFYDSLARLAVYSTTTKLEQKKILRRTIQNQKKMQKWAGFAPMNSLHKFQIVEAEQYRVLGQLTKAMEMYDRAISGAKANGYIQEEALANELAAKFYLDWGKEKVAAGYMQEAYYCYGKWGAKAKVVDLEKRYPQLLQPILQAANQPLTVLETLASIAVPTYSIHSTSHKSSSSSINQTLDFATLLQVSQTFASAIELDELLQTLAQTMLENSGADQCALMLCEENQWQVRVMANLEQVTLQSVPLEDNPTVPVKLIQYVKNTGTTVVMDNIKTDLPVLGDYLHLHQPKSVLCLPILNQGNLRAILYLENRSTSGVFTNERITILNFLCTQAAISLENARLYQKSQEYAQKLEQSQLQIVQSEKMSALGNLVAGVAHEMNNPLGFISATLKQTKPTFAEISEHLQMCREKITDADIIDHAEEIDLDYSLEDFPKMLDGMTMACERLKNISTSLRTFSRADKDYKVTFNIHEGIDSTILILKHRLKANEQRPAIEVITNYSDLPQIDCFPGQLNQVFMNILANAIDALDESNSGRSFAEIQANPNKITITTSVNNNHVKISIADNGKGMSAEVQQKIFDHLFTTKSVGKGTGLGLAIARQIVIEKHGGKLEVKSELGEGTEFCICLPIVG